MRVARPVPVILAEYIRLIGRKYSFSYTRTVQTFLNHFLEYSLVNGIDYLLVKKEHVEKYLVNSKANPSTRRRYVTQIHQFYEWLSVPVNPASGIKIKCSSIRPLVKVPSQHDIESVFALMAAEQRRVMIRNRFIIALGYGSGLRRVEIWHLRVEDVNLAGKVAFIIGKGGRTRMVPLTAETIDYARDYLRVRAEYCGPTGPLLINFRDGKPLTLDGLGNIIRKESGYASHSYRRACATHMLQNGCSIRYIQELLGHVKITTTQHYTRVDKRGLQRIVARFHPRAKNAVPAVFRKPII